MPSESTRTVLFSSARAGGAGSSWREPIWGGSALTVNRAIVRNAVLTGYAPTPSTLSLGTDSAWYQPNVDWISADGSTPVTARVTVPPGSYDVSSIASSLTGAFETVVDQYGFVTGVDGIRYNVASAPSGFSTGTLVAYATAGDISGDISGDASGQAIILTENGNVSNFLIQQLQSSIGNVIGFSSDAVDIGKDGNTATSNALLYPVTVIATQWGSTCQTAMLTSSTLPCSGRTATGGVPVLCGAVPLSVGTTAWRGDPGTHVSRTTWPVTLATADLAWLDVETLAPIALSSSVVEVELTCQDP